MNTCTGDGMVKQDIDVVEVNECAIFVSQKGVDWWLLFRHGQPARIRIITQSVAGDRVHVLCDDRAHAEWLEHLLIEKGAPRSAVRRRRIRVAKGDGRVVPHTASVSDKE